MEWPQLMQRIFGKNIFIDNPILLNVVDILVIGTNDEKRSVVTYEPENIRDMVEKNAGAG